MKDYGQRHEKNRLSFRNSSGIYNRCRTKVNFDNLVFDFSGCQTSGGEDGVLRELRYQGSNVSAQGKFRQQWTSSRASRLFSIGFFFSITTLIIGSIWLYFSGEYVAETKILFISPISTVSSMNTGSIDRELDRLRSVSLARQVADQTMQQEVAPSPIKKAFFQNNDVASPLLKARKLRDDLYFKVERWGEVGWVTVGIKGYNPDFLLSNLQTYVRCYLDSTRHSDKLAVGVQHRPPSIQQLEGNTALVTALDQEIGRTEIMQHHRELALKLLYRKTGTFTSFFPNGTASGLITLKRINEELVKLAIKRRRLSTRFQESSKEIKLLDKEINGLKMMLIKHLKHQVTFLQMAREQLLSRKNEVKSPTLVTQASDNRTANDNNDASWGRLVTGLRAGDHPNLAILYGRPLIVKRPFWSRIMEFLGYGSNYIFDNLYKRIPLDSPKETVPQIACNDERYPKHKDIHQNTCKGPIRTCSVVPLVSK